MDTERYAERMAEALRGGGIAAGTARIPVFGEWMRGIWASDQNPQRDGMYVKTIRRSGRFNPGTFYELTNGRGSFWTYPDASTVFIAPPND